MKYQSLFALNIIKSWKMIEVNQEFYIPPSKVVGKDRITIVKRAIHLCGFNKTMKD